MSGAGVPRLPTAPEQPPPEEDAGCSPRPLGPDEESPGETLGLRHHLDECMRRLEERLDRLAERLDRPVDSPLARARPPPRHSLLGPRQSQTEPRDPTQSMQCMRSSASSSPPSGFPSSPSHTPRRAAPQQDGEMRKASVASSVAATIVESKSTTSGLPWSSRSKNFKEWLVKQSERTTKAFAARKVGTAERISNHWTVLEQNANLGQQGGRISKIVAHRWFDWSITAVVMFSAIMVGVQVDYEASNAGLEGRYFDYAEYGCTGIFTVELAMRIGAYGRRRLCSEGERVVFFLDVFLVLASWLEVVMAFAFAVAGIGTNTPVGRLIKVFRIGRLMRIIRTVRFFTELRVVASMIWSSVHSLMWLFFILVSMSYCFALVLTQGASVYIGEVELEPDAKEKILAAFGSVLLTMYSLFKSMTGGRNWGEVAELIAPAGWLYAALIVMYIFLNLFSVLNIVTGVFVDGAIELGKRDRSMMIQEQGKKREAFAQHLVQLLRDMDSSGDGVITREEFLASFSRPEVKEFMHALSIDLDDAQNMFTLLDRNMDGEVDIVEFVMGMEKLRGEAKSTDIHFLIMQSQHMMDMLTHLQGVPLADPWWLPGSAPRPGSKHRRNSKNRFSYCGMGGETLAENLWTSS